MMVFVYSISHLPHLILFYSSNGKEERERQREKGIDFHTAGYRPIRCLVSGKLVILS